MSRITKLNPIPVKVSRSFSTESREFVAEFFTRTSEKEPVLPIPTPAPKSSLCCEKIAWGGLLVVALAVRCLVCVYWSTDLTVDRDAYLGIVRNIRLGNGFCSPDTITPTAYRPPAYPLLVALFELVCTEPYAVASLNILAGIATAAGVWVLVGQWWLNPPLWKRVIAGLAIAADPLLLRYTAQPMTECVFTALTVWLLVGISSLVMEQKRADNSHDDSPPERSETRLSPLVTGILAGVAILCRPTLLPFVGLISLGLVGRILFVGRWGHAKEWTALTKFVIGWCVVLGIWVARNQMVMGHPILTTTHGGYTLLLGNNPVFYREVARQPWGTVWQHDSLIGWQAALADQLQQEYGPKVDEITADRWHFRQATHAMHNDPDGFHAAVAYRIRSFWSLTPRGPEDSSRVFRGIVSVWYATLFLFAAIGFIRAGLQRHPAVLLGGLVILSVAALHLLYWTDTRMRAPLHPVFVVMAVAPARRKS